MDAIAWAKLPITLRIHRGDDEAFNRWEREAAFELTRMFWDDCVASDSRSGMIKRGGGRQMQQMFEDQQTQAARHPIARHRG